MLKESRGWNLSVHIRFPSITRVPSVKQTIFCQFFFLSTVFWWHWIACRNWGLQEPNLTTDSTKIHLEMFITGTFSSFSRKVDTSQTRRTSETSGIIMMFAFSAPKNSELSPVEDLQTFRPTTLWWKTKILLSACFSRSVLIFFCVFCSDLTSHWNSITSTTTS